jgi:hypothetical protein
MKLKKCFQNVSLAEFADFLVQSNLTAGLYSRKSIFDYKMDDIGMKEPSIQFSLMGVCLKLSEDTSIAGVVRFVLIWSRELEELVGVVCLLMTKNKTSHVNIIVAIELMLCLTEIIY